MSGFPTTQAPSLQARLRCEQVRLLYAQSPVLLVGILLLVLTTGWFLWGRANAELLQYWLAANLLLWAGRGLLSWLFLRRADLTRHPLWWGTAFACGSALSGFFWGSLAIWALDTGDLAQTLYLVTVLSAMASGSLTALSAWAPAYYAYAIPSLTLLIGGLLAAGGEAFYLLALLEGALLVTHLFFSANIQRNVRETLRMRFENALLYEQAKQANREKTRFLAAASHDLRQPHQALGLFLEALRDTPTQHAEYQTVLGHARQAFAALSDLLDQLLDISRIDAGTVRADIQPVALMPLLHRLMLQNMPQADGKGLELRLRPNQAVVMADAGILERILSNLLQNAIRYTDAGGILMAARRRDGCWRLEVWDTGCGIPRDQLERVFREFTQLDNPERDREKGLGLGLAIVRRLAGLIGAQVSVHSRPGKGSCFAVTLPVGTAAPVANKIPPVQAAQGLEAMTVAVIDDDRLARKGLEVLLQTWGCKVLAFGSQEACVQYLVDKGSQPQALIADYRLRGHQTGAGAIAAVRQQMGRDIPAIIVTGDTAPERVAQARSHGLPMLRKPVDPKDLRDFLIGATEGAEYA